ncbi:MAG: anti-sigma factor domain-containing protein [Acidimicrobiia bacterium]
MGELTLEEFRDLLPLYAIDAVPLDQRRAVDVRLADDLDARREVMAYQETIAAVVGDAEPPASLWNRIATQIHADADPSQRDASADVVDLASRREARGWRTAGIAIAAATVAAVFAFGVASVVNDSNDSSASPAGIERAAEQARRQPNATVVPLRTPSGATSADVVYLPDGNAWFESRSLPSLPGDRTYQLWAIVGGKDAPHVISAGVLGREPGTWGFRFDGPVEGFALTEELAPGVVASAHDPIAIGNIS